MSEIDSTFNTKFIYKSYVIPYFDFITSRDSLVSSLSFSLFLFCFEISYYSHVFRGMYEQQPDMKKDDEKGDEEYMMDDYKEKILEEVLLIDHSSLFFLTFIIFKSNNQINTHTRANLNQQ